MKKMRRLIPAFAMLMVAAIMLSTASFAWFTMNDQVTASGMQIQAQASGSLVIGTEPLNFASAATKADISSTTTNKLRPMTWGTFTPATGASYTGWMIPDAAIDPDTGHFAGAQAWAGLDFVTAVANGGDNEDEYYVEKVLYIGSAGDKLTEQYITIDLAALVAPDSEATKAYAIAIYVNEYRAASNDWATTAPNATPAARIYVDDLDGRNTIVLKGANDAGYTIPSIVGVGAQDDKVTGIQIVVRFYVDGALDAVTINEDDEVVNATKSVVTGYEYTEAESFSVNGAYYVMTAGASTTEDASDDVYEPAVITEDMTDFPEGATWYTRTVKEEDKEYKYVNSDDVPTSGTSLEITISSDTKPAN